MGASSKKEFPPLLQTGFHSMSMTDLRKRCVDAFAGSATRPDIMAGLERVITTLNLTGLRAEVWVDGSFLTEKQDPEDSDIVVRVAGADFDTATQDQLDALEWLNGDLKPTYFCDSYYFIEYEKSHRLGADGEWNRAYWLRQFGFTRRDEPKGLAVIILPLWP